MSYHLNYGQADWFFKDPATVDVAAPGAVPAPATTTPAIAVTPTPTTPVPTSTAASVTTSPVPLVPDDYEDESMGMNMILIGGVGILALVAALAWWKLAGGGSEEAQLADLVAEEPQQTMSSRR